MRSFWMDRLFRHAYAGDRVLTPSLITPSALPSRADGKSRAAPTCNVRVATARRLCLGIGDGGVRRQ